MDKFVKNVKKNITLASVRNVTYVEDKVPRYVEERDYNFTKCNRRDSKRVVNGRNRNTIDMIAGGTKCRH